MILKEHYINYYNHDISMVVPAGIDIDLLLERMNFHYQAKFLELKTDNIQYLDVLDFTEVINLLEKEISNNDKLKYAADLELITKEGIRTSFARYFLVFFLVFFVENYNKELGWHSK